MIPQLTLISTGVKSGPLPKADLYLDCRVIRNPFHVPELKGASGDDAKVQKWVMEANPEIYKRFVETVDDLIDTLPARRQGEQPFERPVVVCFMCAHGVHRSRAMKNLVGYALQARKDLKVEVA